ncbi:unnamed protein product [Darwinula stevensoni]|uniref:Ketoreductase domain-containing protein n=1 Tax=Darwinula stevensoni TaxID=69355 RepID=A0A7R9FQM7_9CRUS|nr:unnamed protein product [Darwinula stevensoni]CAG0899456.1 unnamed protein product [Darwinula stevensoni]
MSYDYEDPFFAGRSALVTGSGKGIGRAITKQLHILGAQVYAISRTQSDLESLASECPGILTYCLDLSDWKKTEDVVKTLPPLDCLVNNAGVTSLESFLETKAESFERVMKTNVQSVLNVSQVVAKHMIKRGAHGSIVNVSSVASTRALNLHTSYCASKAALDSLTRSMALELGPHKIRVNSVNPTVVMTDMGKLAWSDPDKSEPILNRIPLGKFVEVEDVVNAILFLLSDRSSMINGVHLPIEGGLFVS